ncbi:hypothetical protein EXS74_01275 [Candidatus Woesearchaeota archaeon]|nr:hypothetical protein [Candidatus Woesearchaeota archaeon]
MQNLNKLLVDVFNPKKGENIILLNDFPSKEKHIDLEYIQRREMAIEWHKAFEELAKTLQCTVEPIIFYEPTNGDGAPLPVQGLQKNKKIELDKKIRSLSKKDIVLAINRFSATGPLETVLKKQQFRCASMPGVSANMSALYADYSLVAKKVKVLQKKLTEADAAIVTFSTGHEMFFDLRERKALADDGQCTKPGQAINFPSGEAFIAVYDLAGSKTQGFIPVYYENHFLVYEVKENKIIDVITDSPQSREMQKYFQEDPARANIAELGLGCNDKAVFINNVLQDEKIEGMHWAYGYNDYMGGTVGVKDFKDPLHAVHVDVIYTKGAKVKVKRMKLFYPPGKEEIIMENSRYSFNVQKEFEKN